MNIGNRSRALREVRNLLQGDMDESVLGQRLQDAEKLTQKGPVGLTDLQRLLEDKSIDAISIAAPNHSHALQTIWGRQAGKDAYVERPCAHNIFEAKQVLAAAPKYNCMVQLGTDGRSSQTMQEAKRMFTRTDRAPLIRRKSKTVAHIWTRSSRTILWPMAASLPGTTFRRIPTRFNAFRRLPRSRVSTRSAPHSEAGTAITQ